MGTDYSDPVAWKTMIREEVEDTKEAVELQTRIWWNQKRLPRDAHPIVAVKDGDGINVLYSNGMSGLVRLDVPDRSTLNGI